MIAQWRWIVSRVTKRLWFRATLFSALGVMTALLAAAFKGYIPASLSSTVGADAVDNILGIIASSMLAVTTFSLSTMVTAYGAASSGVTPRATTLVMEDTTTQNALATFIGSFLFSLVGIIALSTGVYGDQGRVLLFGVTIAVIVVIVYTLLRWIDHLSKLGRVGETIDRVEKATIAALEARVEWPYLGASGYPANPPSGMTPVMVPKVGYIQHIDVQALGDLAQELDVQLYIQAVPGSFISLGEPIAEIHGANPRVISADLEKRLHAAFSIGVRRTFEHDPRFGLSVLSEIASRALSPAVNDPGTAIDVVGRGVRVFSLLAEKREAQQPDEACKRVYLPGLELDDMLSDFFAPIARDAALMVEVGCRFLKALASLARLNPDVFARAAGVQAELLLAHARHANMLGEEYVKLQALAVELRLFTQN